jgi:hypothetical protein
MFEEIRGVNIKTPPLVGSLVNLCLKMTANRWFFTFLRLALRGRHMLQCCISLKLYMTKVVYD